MDFVSYGAANDRPYPFVGGVIVADYAENPRAVVGGNAPSLSDAIEAFDLVGFLLVGRETMKRATFDDKLDRPCLKVLFILITTMNRETRTSWAGRDYIAAETGLTVKTVSNYIYQLKCLGYIVSERRSTPQANDRVLMHYTVAKLKPHEIEDEIGRFISSIRGTRNSVVEFLPQPEPVKESSSPDRNSRQQVPPLTGTQVPALTGTQPTVPPPAGTKSETIITSSSPDGRSKNNSSFLPTTTTSTSGERGVGRDHPKPKTDRGTRLDPTQELCAECGKWAIANFEITRQQAFAEWEQFSDYWTSQPTAKGRKLNWFKTWRNWIRNSRNKYRPKPNRSAPDLLTFEPEEKSEYDIELEALQRKTREQSDRIKRERLGGGDG